MTDRRVAFQRMELQLRAGDAGPAHQECTTGRRGRIPEGGPPKALWAAYATDAPAAGGNCWAVRELRTPIAPDSEGGHVPEEVWPRHTIAAKYEAESQWYDHKEAQEAY